MLMIAIIFTSLVLNKYKVLSTYHALWLRLNLVWMTILMGHNELLIHGSERFGTAVNQSLIQVKHESVPEFLVVVTVLN